MLRLSKEVDDILLLKKQIKYELSHKGGTNKTRNFINYNIKYNKQFIGLSFYTCFVTIIYIVLCQNKNNTSKSIISIPNNKYMSGGGIIQSTISFILNSIIYTTINATSFPIIVIFSVISILALILIIFLILILDFGLYVPCGGCQKDSTFIKCLPGTGNGSITCSATKQIYKILKEINDIIKKINNQIKVIKKSIKDGLYTVKDAIYYIKDEFIDILGFPLGILEEFFNFMKFLNVGNWGFNLGELLLGGKTENIIYDNDGKLRDEHGSTIFFKLFFKTIRILLETPKVPKLDWPSFGGKPPSLKPIVNPDADPYNQDPSYPIENMPNIPTNDNNIKKPDVPVPDIKDYQKYKTDINSNEIKSDAENNAIMDTNLAKKRKIREIARKKAEKTSNLIKKTNDTLNNIKGKKKRVKYILSEIKNTENKIANLLVNGKKLLNDINKIYKPNFIKIAKIGSIQGDGQSDPSQIVLENRLYVLQNMWEEDMTNEQKNAFTLLNNKMKELNYNTDELDIYKSTLLAYSKQLEIENNKIGDYKNDMKDFLYMKFLELLIQIDINPLLWIVEFANVVVIKPINIAIKVSIIKPSIQLIKIIFGIANKIYKALIGELMKVGKLILIPIYKMIDAFKPILKVFYKVLSTIKELGIFNMIFYYFYERVEKAFSFVNNIFILLFITVIVCSILIGAPMIGGLYETYLLFKVI